jgi:hypothetical protein
MAYRTWTRTTEANAEPSVYVDGFNKIVFMAGKAPWTWDIIETRGVGARKVEELLDAYVERGVKQHDFEGGFDEATKELVTTL